MLQMTTDSLMLYPGAPSANTLDAVSLGSLHLMLGCLLSDQMSGIYMTKLISENADSNVFSVNALFSWIVNIYSSQSSLQCVVKSNDVW